MVYDVIKKRIDFVLPSKLRFDNSFVIPEGFELSVTKP